MNDGRRSVPLACALVALPALAHAEMSVRAELHLGGFSPSEPANYGDELTGVLTRVGESDVRSASGGWAIGGLVSFAPLEWLEVGATWRSFSVDTRAEVLNSTLSQRRETAVDALSGLVRLRYVDEMLFLTLAVQPGYYFMEIDQSGYLADDDLRGQDFGWQFGIGAGLRPIQFLEVGVTVDRAFFTLPEAGAPFVDDGGDGGGFQAGLYVGGRLDL